jgi:hypothetical protein
VEFVADMVKVMSLDAKQAKELLDLHRAEIEGLQTPKQWIGSQSMDNFVNPGLNFIRVTGTESPARTSRRRLSTFHNATQNAQINGSA